MLFSKIDKWAVRISSITVVGGVILSTIAYIAYLKAQYNTGKELNIILLRLNNKLKGRKK